MLDLATHIVNSKSGHFDPSQFEDRYETALVLLKKKEAGEKIEPAKAGPAPRVVNVMDALRPRHCEKEGTGTQRSGSPTC
jgi:DNA end-binding protein Ku